MGMTHLWGRIRGKFGRLLPCDSLDIEGPIYIYMNLLLLICKLE